MQEEGPEGDPKASHRHLTGQWLVLLGRGVGWKAGLLLGLDVGEFPKHSHPFAPASAYRDASRGCGFRSNTTGKTHTAQTWDLPGQTKGEVSLGGKGHGQRTSCPHVNVSWVACLNLQTSPSDNLYRELSVMSVL